MHRWPRSDCVVSAPRAIPHDSGFRSRLPCRPRCVPPTAAARLHPRRQVMKWSIAALVSCLGMALTSAVHAQDKVVTIGAIYPLSGALASTGTELKQAIELAVDVVNNAHPELMDIPLAADAGLPNLGGAKIKVIFADSQGSPSVGQAE